VFARLIFALVQFGARKGLSEAPAEDSSRASVASPKENARRTGIRGETYAYWYLRRHGYTLVARNYTFPGFKGEIDMAGYDGSVLAFVEVKTRSIAQPLRVGAALPSPEEAVDSEKRRNLVRMARQFLRTRRIESAHRFDVLAIETRLGAPPKARLHKDAFRA
jgi:putative endonuclease